MPETLFNTSTFSPLFTKILKKRGLLEEEQIERFLSSELSNLSDPFLMKGMKEAVRRIKQAKAAGETVLVHGDYDVDGVTGAAVVARTLKELEIKTEIFLPDRVEDGYGVSARAIKNAESQGAKLLITVDCGITAKEEITLARELGLDVIVIDHHRIPADGLPPATVILNPLQEDCDYPFKELSAAGLAFKLSQALIGEKAFALLDLATLSTIGDVAPLVDENRIIVKHGLKILSQRSNPGVKALAKVAKLSAREMNVGHVGFILGPRINAAGRMSSAEIAFQLLMTSHDKEADSLAEILNEENKERQREERQTVKEAIDEVDRTMNFNKDRVIVVGRQGWHAGVIGIVASRLVERFYRPAFVIAFDGKEGKASGRSIKGFHLYHTLQAAKDTLKEFGGHEQAAGFSIFETEFKNFREKVNEHAREEYDAKTFVKSVKTDLEVTFEDLSPQFIKELFLLEPHGAGNPRPVFRTKNLKLKTAPVKKYQSYKFLVTDGRSIFEASWTDKSGKGHASILKPNSAVDLAYSVKTKMWDGIQSVALDVKEIKQPL